MQSPDEQPGTSAVEAAYRHHAAALYRYIYRKVGQAALAEDLTSTVFLKALRWLQHERGTQSIRGWLYATARTTIADYWQAQGMWEIVSLDQVEEVSAPAEGTAVEREERAARARVRRLLRRLPERERQVLTLRYFQGYSTEEIGQALGLRSPHVRLVLFRALRRAATFEAAERTGEVGERSGAMDDQETVSDEAVRRVLALAQEEAQALNHHYIGTEHQLLGLLRDEGSRAAAILAQMNVTLERARGGVVMLVGRGDGPADHPLGLTPRAKQVLALAAQEAQTMGSAAVEPEHILLGLLVEGAGIAAGILEALNVRLTLVRSALAPAAEPLAAWSCAFCGKSRNSVERLIHGPGWVARTIEGPPTQPLLICNECVALCAEIIAASARQVKLLPPGPGEGAIQPLFPPAETAGGPDPMPPPNG